MLRTESLRTDRLRLRSELGAARVRVYGQFSKVKSGKMGPLPGRFELPKGIWK